MELEGVALAFRKRENGGLGETRERGGAPPKKTLAGSVPQFLRHRPADAAPFSPLHAWSTCLATTLHDGWHGCVPERGSSAVPTQTLAESAPLQRSPFTAPRPACLGHHGRRWHA